MGKLTGFSTKREGSWGTGPTPRASPTTDLQPTAKPLPASASASWIYCEFEKEKHVCSHLEQLPETWALARPWACEAWTRGPAASGTGGAASPPPLPAAASLSPVQTLSRH